MDVQTSSVMDVHGLHVFGYQDLNIVVVEHQLLGSSGHCPRTRPGMSADSLGAEFGDSGWRCSKLLDTI